MVYNPNVPASGQSLGETRSTIQGNFADIATAFGKNHIPLTTSTDGKHNFVQMPEQGAAPATAANEGALYVKEGVNPAVSTLFFREESSGTEQQVSGSTINAFPGECPLFGGFGIKWGTISIAHSGIAPTAKTITYTSLGLTAFDTDTYAVLFTATTISGTSDLILLTAKSSTSFTAATLITGTFDWVAIGH